MKVTAKLNYLHISPRKVRSVVNIIRGLKASEALAQLRFLPQRSTGPVAKLLKSAIANAEHNFSLAADSLKISSFKVDGGPVLKRFKPKAMGRTAPIRKRTSHLTLVLEGERSRARRIDKPRDELVQNEAKTEIEKQEAVEKEAKVVTRQSRVAKTAGKQVEPGFVRRIFQRKSI